MQSALLKIEQCLDCDICTFSLNQTRVIGNCGHKFCLECITESLKKEPKCPTCQIPALAKDLQKDPMYDNLLAYMDKLKSCLLSHTLTPLSNSLYPSLKTQQQQQQQPQTQSTDSSMPDIRDIDEILPSVSKRPFDSTDTNDEDELEDEYYDSTPTTKKLRAATDSQKKLLVDPKNMLGDMLPPTMSFHSTNNFSQQSTIPRGTQRSIQQGHELGYQPLSMLSAQEYTIGSTSTAASEDTKDITASKTEEVMDLDSIASDIDEKDDQQRTNHWNCPECQFSNAAYLQTCGVCHAYRKKNIPSTLTGSTVAMKTATRPVQSKKNDYKLTVAGENNTLDLPASLSTRRRTEKPQGEAHLLYTGLTPEDEKKLEKIKDDAVQSRLKIFIHYQMRDFDEITHIITSVDKKKLCRRTLKYLQGILEGKWIVNPTWLIDSMKSKKWQPEEKYEVQGDQASGVTHGPSQGKKKSEKLFDGMTFYFFGDFTGKHSKNDLLILCRAGGAKIINRKPTGRGSRVDETDKIDRSEPIVIHSSNKKKHPSWLYECQVRDPAWIIECISHLKVE